MNHLRTFEQHALLEKESEGIIQKGINKAKELLGLKSNFKVRYTVTVFGDEEEETEREKPKKGEEKKEVKKEKAFKPAGEYTMNVTIRAASEDEAEDIFREKFEKKTKGMEPKPSVRVNRVSRTKAGGKKEIEIPSVNKD